MDTIKLSAAVFVALISTAFAQAPTNLAVGWRICEQHGHVIGKPSIAVGPARMVFDAGYGACEKLQTIVPSMKAQMPTDQNRATLDQMLIERAIKDPNTPAQ